MGVAYENMRLMGFNERIGAFRLNSDGSFAIFDFNTAIYPDKIYLYIQKIRDTITPGFFRLTEYFIYGISKVKDAVLYIVQIVS